MATVEPRVETARGCGYRKPGGKYLVSGTLSKPCGKLPIPLTYCPCCGAGIKFSRGFQWVGKQLIEDAECSIPGCRGCHPFDGSVHKFGLMWVGEQFYRLPEDFAKEVAVKGLSKRIATIPKGLEIGKTWILLAHIRAVLDPHSMKRGPGIFRAFVPTAIEYIVKGDETEEELDRLEERGFKLIKVVRDTENQMKIEDENCVR
jgi:hypothetical protein